ncbi:MAG: hypothetical protein H6R44_528 [Nitrospirae bacterium]|nr:hypothetical protein [Nitrospirota bacterium]
MEGQFKANPSRGSKVNASRYSDGDGTSGTSDLEGKKSCRPPEKVL